MAIQANTDLGASVSNELELDNCAVEVIDALYLLLDNVESGEPLQARQTFSNLKAFINAIETFIDQLPVETINGPQT